MCLLRWYRPQWDKKFHAFLFNRLTLCHCRLSELLGPTFADVSWILWGSGNEDWGRRYVTTLVVSLGISDELSMSMVVWAWLNSRLNTERLPVVSTPEDQPAPVIYSKQHDLMQSTQNWISTTDLVLVYYGNFTCSLYEDIMTLKSQSIIHIIRFGRRPFVLR